MHIEGTQKLQAPRQQVWRLLNNPLMIRRCVPGLRDLQMSGADGYRMMIGTDLGPMRPVLEFQLTVASAEPARGGHLRIRGRGANSCLGASSRIALADAGDGATELSWSFRISAFGQIAKLGNGILRRAVDQAVGAFFGRVQELLDQGVELAPAPLRRAS